MMLTNLEIKEALDEIPYNDLLCINNECIRIMNSKQLLKKNIYLDKYGLISYDMSKNEILEILDLIQMNCYLILDSVLKGV